MRVKSHGCNLTGYRLHRVATSRCHNRHNKSNHKKIHFNLPTFLRGTTVQLRQVLRGVSPHTPVCRMPEDFDDMHEVRLCFARGDCTGTHCRRLLAMFPRYTVPLVDRFLLDRRGVCFQQECCLCETILGRVSCVPA